MFHRFTQFAGAAIVAGGLGLAAVAMAGTASALTGANDDFLSQVEDAGISATPQVAVRNAQLVCELMGEGETVGSIGAEIVNNSDLSTCQAAEFIVASVDAFCRPYNDELAPKPLSPRGKPQCPRPLGVSGAFAVVNVP